RDFEIGGVGAAERKRDRGGKHGRQYTDFHEFSSLTETLPEKLRSIDFSTQLSAGKFFRDNENCYFWLFPSEAPHPLKRYSVGRSRTCVFNLSI
ncbi:hypothetical protein ACCT09_33860, partial [Rhizobium ruizarguesonis]